MKSNFFFFFSSTFNFCNVNEYQTLRHVAEMFKRVSIETMKAETYTSSLYVHLNMLQDKVTLHSQVNDCTQETRQECELIRARLVSFNRIIAIREEAKIQSRRRQLALAATTLTSDSIAITQYHKSQWEHRWEKYRRCSADVNVTLAQRLHLLNKTIKMQNDFQKAESSLATHIQTERIDLNAYLHFRNVSGTDNSRCDCEWSHQTAKHVLMHCLNWSHLRLKMLRDVDFLNYWIIIVITKSLRTAAKMRIKTKLLKQFRVIESLIL